MPTIMGGKISAKSSVDGIDQLVKGHNSRICRPCSNIYLNQGASINCYFKKMLAPKVCRPLAKIWTKNLSTGGGRPLVGSGSNAKDILSGIAARWDLEDDLTHQPNRR